jgi:hypothetical protein
MPGTNSWASIATPVSAIAASTVTRSGNNCSAESSDITRNATKTTLRPHSIFERTASSKSLRATSSHVELTLESPRQ